MIDMARLTASLKLHEGVRDKPYDDKTGLPPVIQGKLTGGIGRNLTDKGFRATEMEFMCQNDVAEALGALSRYYWFNLLDTVRATAVTEIMFALGATKYAGFVHMNDALAAKNWPRAAAELTNSNLPNPGQWGVTRVRTISEMLLHGAWQ